jgi:integrase
MGRKRKVEKRTVTVVINGTTISVVLHPPKPPRRAWYAYWPGLKTSKSTGQVNFDAAVKAVEGMLGNGGKRGELADGLLSDEEFIEIQRSHFGRKTEERAKQRSQQSLDNCLEAIAAFQEITGLRPMSLATPDDCAKFQQIALTLPGTWRRKRRAARQPASYYSEKSRKERRAAGKLDPLDEIPCYSPNNVLRWSRSLQASFERVNRNALKRKCVRGLVDANKLLESNPWNQFTWIEGSRRPIRQFDGSELLSFMDHLATRWGGIPLAATAAKVFLWSGCRKSEIAGLKWDSLRFVGNERHFEIVGKWGVERWFRLPEGVYEELLSFRRDSPFVFAAYTEQLREFLSRRPNLLNNLKAEFSPDRFGSWFYERVVEWSKTAAKGRAFVHIFRKTTLQHARRGEDIARQIAADLRVSESVLMTNYVKETDEEMRQRSNRTYRRILASLSSEVATRYGYVLDPRSEMENELRVAVDAQDWEKIAEISKRLSQFCEVL